MVVVGVQMLCTLFFLSDILASVVGVEREPMAWETRELMEIGAGIGLLLGVLLGALLLARSLLRTRDMESRLREVSGAFTDLLEQRFREWGLTRAERDVAWFTIKGLSIADIARLRGTSEGTVKAHSNAIYRKAGVGSRAQLVSLFLEDLMSDGLDPVPADGSGTPPAAPPDANLPAAPEATAARRRESGRPARGKGATASGG